MAVILNGYYTPGHKPEISSHEKQKNIKMTSYPGKGNDCQPLPVATNGGCFANKAEQLDAHKKWQSTYQKTGA